MTCKQCGHKLLDHFFGRCEMKGSDGKRCTCVVSCRGCGHGLFDHFLGFCSVEDCHCIAGRVIKETHKDRAIPDCVVVGRLEKRTEEEVLRAAKLGR